MTRLCAISGCGRPHSALSWCNLHYQRYLAHGDALWEPPTHADRFWAKVEKTDSCWLWHGALHAGGRTGYGWTGSELAHRFAYESLHGPIPDSLTLDHLCRVRLCVNPNHLEPVTIAVNTLRGEAPTVVAHRTGVCGRGHRLTGANLYITPNGRQRCRACVAMRDHGRKR